MMVSGEIDSPIIKIPKTTIAAKKDFTGNRKQLKFSARMEEPVSKYVSINTFVIRLSYKLIINLY